MELSVGERTALFVGAMSLWTLTLYGLDKRKARARSWRIPEKVLLGCGLLGGAPGALAGMMLFRHKTRHWYFWSVNALAGAFWLILLLQTFMRTIN